MLVPLAFILWIAVQTGWAESYRLIVRPRVGELLVNTALLVLLTVPICAVLSIALAWLTERTDLPGARLWSLLAVAPLAIPAFVHSYAWVTMLPGFHGLPAGVLISVIAYFPFLYLPVSASLRRLDPALEDAAASLGLNPSRVFLRVVLPQLRLAVCGGSLLVGLHLLAEYGLFVFVRFDTFTTAIVDQFQSTFNGPAATMLAGVLVACCLALLAFEMLVRGEERYARVGSGAARLRRVGQGLGQRARVADMGPGRIQGAADDFRPEGRFQSPHARGVQPFHRDPQRRLAGVQGRRRRDVHAHQDRQHGDTHLWCDRDRDREDDQRRGGVADDLSQHRGDDEGADRLGHGKAARRRDQRRPRRGPRGDDRHPRAP